MNSSVLVVSAEVPRQQWGRAALQAGVDGPLDIVEVYRHACEYSAIIGDPSNFEELLKQALRAACSIPYRTAHLSLPQDVASLPVANSRLPRSPSNYRAVQAGVPEGQVSRTLEILAGSALPLVWLGNGCRRVLYAGTRALSAEAAKIAARRQRFFAFLERFCLPVVTTGNAKGLFPESSPLSLRNYGLGGSPWPSAYVHPQRTSPGFAGKYDALCVLGSSLSQLGTNSWATEMIPDGPFVQVDADQRVIGRGYPIDIGIVAELAAFIDRLSELSEKCTTDPTRCRERLQYLAAVRQTRYPRPNPQAEFVIAIAKALPSDSHVFVDACTADALSLLYFVIDPPMQMHNSLVQGPIGSATAGVVGAALATERACVAICGDGGFLMHGAEVSTAAQHRLGCLWIVFQNRQLGTVVQKMEQDFPDKGGRSWGDFLSIGDADVVSFAKALGADAVEVRTPQMAGPAITASLANGKNRGRPQVIVIPTGVYPIPPASGPPSG